MSLANKFTDFYNQNISNFGLTSQGVGWKNEAAQLVRFEQLIKILDPIKNSSINDLGCGTGDLIPFLQKKNFLFTYTGYDMLPVMIDLARNRHSKGSNIEFKLIEKVSELESADYTVASGIFNIRFEQTDEFWESYILETLRHMNLNSKRGFAFNLLTKYSDSDFMKNELYYADPCFLFDYCKKNFSKNVALLHDYDQYDFTILVRK